MSCIKRWLEDEVEKLAKETGYSWDVLMDELIVMEFDLEALQKRARDHCIGM